ncbi:hypothetical protein E1B28_008243 [Marasmius oreades]|uniref:DUF6534 domain-containing protein n=1 Tax=Marasmius oreades TaxID=181124 RepID=A0A9P7RXX3_9AGAR|nr:uncharacterized protein E1B28_008243 [Marasmius oreades]KAG7091839.1 hypothetical protein E1B28_008243 [Marasmius oreades]
MPSTNFEVTNTSTKILTSLFHWGLFGILTIQIFLYHKSSSQDKLAIRVIFYFIYIMEATQTAWVARKVYLFCGSGFGDPAVLLLAGSADSGDEAFVIKTGIVGLLCQCFSAWRIWILSRSKVMAIAVVALSLLSTAATFAGGARMIELSERDFPRDIITTVWAISSALCDTTIAVFMGLILKRSKVMVQPGTRRLITKILWLTVTTGTLTAFMALSALVLLLASPNAGLYFPVIVLIGKVEANSYLAVLNSRIHLQGLGRSRDTTPGYSDFDLGSARFEAELGSSNSVSASESRRSVLQVHVQQQRVEHIHQLPLPVLPAFLREGSAFTKGDDTKNDNRNTPALMA